MRIWVPGYQGMLGKALVRRLRTVPAELLLTSRADLDCESQLEVRQWVKDNRPDWIIIAAARVGGILANRDYPAEFMRTNIMIASNIIDSAHKEGVEKLLHVASSAIYPSNVPQPIREIALLSGEMEYIHLPYSLAKIAGIQMCRAYRQQYGCNFISAALTNLYGPNDNFDKDTSHVVPALIRNIDEARRSNADSVEVWGTGTARRELLHVEDAADAIVFLMNNYDDDSHINVGFGKDVEIRELVDMICEVIGFRGKIIQDFSKPDGVRRKLLDSTKLRELGWKPSIPLQEGLASTYRWFDSNRHP